VSKPLTIGGSPRAPQVLLYEEICEAVARLPMRERQGLAQALNQSAPYESLSGPVKALFGDLAAWAWASPPGRE
jgi:hypothetical protein